jgi:hypothetical protein
MSEIQDVHQTKNEGQPQGDQRVLRAKIQPIRHDLFHRRSNLDKMGVWRNARPPVVLQVEG